MKSYIETYRRLSRDKRSEGSAMSVASSEAAQYYGNNPYVMRWARRGHIWRCAGSSALGLVFGLAAVADFSPPQTIKEGVSLMAKTIVSSLAFRNAATEFTGADIVDEGNPLGCRYGYITTDYYPEAKDPALTRREQHSDPTTEE